MKHSRTKFVFVGAICVGVLLTNIAKVYAKPAVAGGNGPPMSFELRSDIGRELPPRFEYSIDESRDIVIADKNLIGSVFQVRLKKSGADINIEVQWPATFLSRGKLVLRADRDILISHSFNVEDVRTETVNTKTGDTVAVALEDFTLEAKDIQEIAGKGTFRICVEDRDSQYSLSFCFRPTRIIKGKMVLASKDISPMVVKVNGLEVGSQGTINLASIKQSIKLTAVFPDGATFEVLTKPAQITVLDYKMADSKIILRGQGGPPIGENIKIDSTFEQTWIAELEPGAPVLKVMGTGRIPFVHEYYFLSKVPVEANRTHLAARSPNSTYSTSLKLFGKVPSGFVAEAYDGTVKQNPGDTNILWEVKNLKAGRTQRRAIQVKSKDVTTYQYTDIYRAFPYEGSFRLTGVADTSTGAPTLLFHGEIAGGAWFESIGIDHYWLSDRRWGVYGRYFSGLNGKEDQLYTLAAVDAKYRFTPGVWSQDETWGVAFGTARFTQNKDSLGPLLGVGLFWARKMPQFFDQVFNIIPWFRYPKWVDLDFVYYPMTIDSKNTVNQAYKLNFHGKMMLTSQIFLEAGFGLMGFNWSYQKIDGRKSGVVVQNVVMSYGTGGIGMNF